MQFSILNEKNLKVGAISPNGYILTKRIDNFIDLYKYLKNYKSIFARHKLYPTAVIINWNIALCEQWLNLGYFYEIIKIDKQVAKTLLTILEK